MVLLFLRLWIRRSRLISIWPFVGSQRALAAQSPDLGLLRSHRFGFVAILMINRDVLGATDQSGPDPIRKFFSMPINHVAQTSYFRRAAPTSARPSSTQTGSVAGRKLTLNHVLSMSSAQKFQQSAPKPPFLRQLKQVLSAPRPTFCREKAKLFSQMERLDRLKAQSSTLKSLIEFDGDLFDNLIDARNEIVDGSEIKPACAGKRSLADLILGGLPERPLQKVRAVLRDEQATKTALSIDKMQATVDSLDKQITDLSQRIQKDRDWLRMVDS